jgi:AMP-polyphosphate phosphotransferase
MFESAELGHTIDKETYAARLPELRAALLDAQFDLREAARFPVIILIGGVDGAGKGETVNQLNEWLDPRSIQTHAIRPPSDEEKMRPPVWRFWRKLPPKGRIGIFFGSWYTEPILQRGFGKLKSAAFDERLEEVIRFERMLIDEGVVLLKLWFHLSKKQQKHRLKELSKDPQTAWRVTPTDWEHHGLYDRFRKVSEHAVSSTSTASAPWLVVEGSDERYRSLTVGTALLQSIQRRLASAETPPAPLPAVPVTPAIDKLHLLESIDLTVSLDKKEYEEALPKWQGRLALATRKPSFKKRRSVVAVFEGSDAAGKGGAIRRVTRSLDARQFDVIPIAAPSDEERAQPYLWRFWRHVPRRGSFTIFDRSWYGRVLVERVESFCSEAAWTRAYDEINDFEELLARYDVILVKFWLQITKDEQLRRFEEREKTGFKQYKITPEDWRNREKWDAYEEAVCDMVERTSTKRAPWTIVEANDKQHARVKVLRTLAERIEDVL